MTFENADLPVAKRMLNTMAKMEAKKCQLIPSLATTIIWVRCR